MKQRAVRAALRTCWIVICSSSLWAQYSDEFLVDGRTRTQFAVAVSDPTRRPHLGLLLWDHTASDGGSRCLVVHLYRGPAGEAGVVREGDLILAVNDVEVRSAEQFRQQFERVQPGSEVRLRLERAAMASTQPPATRRVVQQLMSTNAFGMKGDGIGGGAIETVGVQAGSVAEWMQPVDLIRSPGRRVVPEDFIHTAAGPTKLEQLLDRHLREQEIKEPMDRLRKHLAGTLDRYYGLNMLDRVAYGYHRPTRLAELQVSITQPLARVADERKNAWEAPRLVLAEAAKNLDVAFSQAGAGTLNLASPREALEDAARMINRAHAQLDRALGKLDPSRRVELEASLSRLLDLYGRNIELLGSPVWHDRALTRCRQASLTLDFRSLVAAANAVVGWSPAGVPPPAGDLQPAPIPIELEGAVKGVVLAVERIGGRWYVYGGHGRNEYDLSRIDVVINPSGGDFYRYPRQERPRIQLVVDWAGNDVYRGENGATGPASALLGVDVVIDRVGNDRYEGDNRSSGVGVMGIGLVVDHSGNDRYRGAKWSLGAGYYGFGAILDLTAPGAPRGEDSYIAEYFSQGIGGPRGVGLILDEKGDDLYRANGPIPYLNTGRFEAFSQGVGIGDWRPYTGPYDTGGIGVICDLAGSDRYEVGAYGQGFSMFMGLGILYDRAGNDLYSGDRFPQASAAHSGIGILADDSGDDTYWAIGDANQSGGGDHVLTLLIDRSGNDSYQAVSGRAQGTADSQSIALLVDLDGNDRYVTVPYLGFAVGQGQSLRSAAYYRERQCFSFSLLLDAGGTPDFYSGVPGRRDGIVKSTGSFDTAKPELSPLHGLFIDSHERSLLWP